MTNQAMLDKHLVNAEDHAAALARELGEAARASGQTDVKAQLNFLKDLALAVHRHILQLDKPF